MKKKLLLLALGALFVKTAAFSQEVIVGGDMEDASQWTIIGKEGLDLVEATFNYDLDGPTGGSGGCLNFIGSATSEAYMYQKVTVVPGHKYKFNCLIKNISAAPITGSFVALILGDKEPEFSSNGFDADSADFNYIKHPWTAKPSFEPMDTTMFGTCDFILKKGRKDSEDVYQDSILVSDTIEIQADSPTEMYVTLRLGSWAEDIEFLIDDVTLFDVTNPVSVAQINTDKNFSVFPNPSNGIINIETNSNLAKYNIYNTVGALVKSGSVANQLDITSLKKGTYVIRLDNTATVEYHQIIIK
jgi:hypothetical protein